MVDLVEVEAGQALKLILVALVILHP